MAEQINGHIKTVIIPEIHKALDRVEHKAKLAADAEKAEAEKKKGENI